MIATPPPHLLNTPRLYLRALGPADIDVVMPLRSDPAAMERMLEGVQDRRAALETLKNFEAFWTTQGIGMFGVFTRDEDRFIGEAGVMMRPDGLGLALRYSFLPAARGRGYAREAVMAIIDHALRELSVGVHVVLVGGIPPEPDLAHQQHCNSHLQAP